MDIAYALKDIDTVLGTLKEHDETSVFVAVAAERITRLQACIVRYAPMSSVYRQRADEYGAMTFAKNVRLPGGAGIDQLLIGVLKALRSDLENGRLVTYAELVRGDLYADLVAQGEALLADKFARAAAVVVGAALEDHIRKLAAKTGTGTTMPNGDPKKASVMNADLKKSGLYSEAQRAAVEGWQKLRNDAAHGEPGFDGVDTAKVAFVTPMIAGVRAFVGQYPA